MILNNLHVLCSTVDLNNRGLKEAQSLTNFSLLMHQRESWRSFLFRGVQSAFEEFQYMTFKHDNSLIRVIFQPKFIYFRTIRLKELRGLETFGYNLFIPVILSDYDIMLNQSKKEIASFKWLNLGILPSLTSNTSFLIEGVSRAISTQVKKSPGLIFGINFSIKTSFIFPLGLPYVQLLAPRGSWFTITYNSEDLIVIEVRGIPLKIPFFLFLLCFGWPLETIFDFLDSDFSRILGVSFTAEFNSFINKYSKFFTTFVARAKLLAYFSGSRYFKKTIKSRFEAELVTNGFFHSNFWNSETRYCGETTRLHLFQKIESPIPLDCMLLEDVDFLYLFKSFITRIVYKHFKDEGADHLKNKRLRTCGDFIYLQTRQGLFDFESSINKILYSLHLQAQEDELYGLSFFEDEDVLYGFPFFDDEEKYEEKVVNVPKAKTTAPKPHTKKNKLHTIFFCILNKKKLNFLKKEKGFNLADKFNIKIGFLFDDSSFSSQVEEKLFEIELFYKEKLSILRKILTKSWKSFFLSGTLSQFAENLNPLSFITHIRRLTSLGPGGLEKAQASVEVRSIDSSYYGRICPIETPEGFNAGLVHSFSLFTRRELNGELSLPYKLVYKGLLQSHELRPLFLHFHEEYKFSILSGDIISGKWNGFPIQLLSVRNDFRIEKENLPQVCFQSFSPYHMISLVTGLIPFLEHNDANRTLMGSNMQRQTVPVLGAEKAFVRTGFDTKLFADTQSLMQSPATGLVFNKNSHQISIYDLKKNAAKSVSFCSIKKTNQDTFIIESPLQKKLLWLERGDFCSDTSIAKFGKLALGPNLLVAYLPWYGYNYEDAIVLSNRCVFQKTLTSLHVEEIICSLELAYREVKKVKEFFYEVPVNFETLIGFIRPSYYQLKKYTRAHSLNTKLINVKQPSFWKAHIAPIDISIKTGDCLFSKCRIRLSLTRDLKLQYKDLFILLKDTFPTFDDFENFANIFGFNLLMQQHKINKYSSIDLSNVFSHSNLVQKSALFKKHRHKAIIEYYHIEDTSVLADYEHEGFVISKEIKKKPIIITSTTPFKLEEDLIEYPENEDEGKKYYYNSIFTQNVTIQIIKQRNIQLGDKCAGRHGNKGIVSKICHSTEMPYLPDGTRIDVVLNPLGIPSRMNVGQIFECLLGLAGFYLKESYIVNLFDEQFGVEASRSFVLSKVYQASVRTGKSWLFIPNHPGKTRVFDGTTGRLFQQPVTVGWSSILKLIHMVDDKVHARSTAGYSLLTEQPTRGRSFLGGQRVGEMELWALQGHGSAWVLQELYTLKSDSVDIRKYFKNYSQLPYVTWNINENYYYSLKEIEAFIASNFDQPFTLEVFLQDLKALCLSVEI